MRATALFLLCVTNCAAQAPPDAGEILKKVADVYRDVSQYEIESTARARDPETGKELTGRMRLAFRKPDKYRAEAKGTFLSIGGDAAGLDEVLSVYDGMYLWAYSPKSNEYRQYVVPRLPRDSRPEDIDLYAGIGTYRHAVEVFQGPKLVRQETIAFDGGDVGCFVIQAGYGGQDAVSVWIDKSTYHVLRLQGSDASTEFNRIKLDEPLPDDLFKFEPPAGSRKLER